MELGSQEYLQSNRRQLGPKVSRRLEIFRIGGMPGRVSELELEQALLEVSGVLGARANLAEHPRTVTIRATGDVEVESVLRRFGYSSDAKAAATVAESWRQFLAREQLGDD